MTDRLRRRKVEDLVARLEPGWDASAYEDIQASVVKRLSRPEKPWRLVAAFSGGIVLAVIGVVAFHGGGRDPSPRVPEQIARAPEAQGPPVSNVNSSTPIVAHERLADVPIEITAVSPRTTVQPVQTSDGRTYRLVQGKALFRSSGLAEVPLRVVARDLLIEDIGTVFSVQLDQEATVRVSVQEGLVLVSGPDVHRVLGAGESARFPDQVRAERMVARSRATSDEHQRMHTTNSDRGESSKDLLRPPVQPPAPEWTQLAESGRYKEAFSALATDVASELTEPRALMLAADAARLSGHPEEALRFLQRFLQLHPGDPRAVAARFSEGKLLMQLDRPREAAVSFETLFDGPLAQEALVRAAEAHARSGDRVRAAALARTYRARFPTGPLDQLVKSYAE